MVSRALTAAKIERALCGVALSHAHPVRLEIHEIVDAAADDTQMKGISVTRSQVQGYGRAIAFHRLPAGHVRLPNGVCIEYLRGVFRVWQLVT